MPIDLNNAGDRFGVGGTGRGSGNRLGKRLRRHSRISLCHQPTRLGETWTDAGKSPVFCSRQTVVRLRPEILGLVQGCGLHTPSLQTRAVSVQHPLLAQPVVEACLALPVWQLTLGRRDRALARQAFADRLPEALVARRSKGEMTAFYGHLIADGLDVLRPWLLHGRLADMGLIDLERADEALTRESLAWKGGYVDIMTTAAIESWVRAACPP